METTNESSTKRQKVSEGQQISLSVGDRLSGLPDSIICHILSFLLTQRSVQTSVLAKRWRSLWAYVPTLDFDNKDPRPPNTCFSSIINRVMLHRRVKSINTFRFHDQRYDRNKYEIETWISTAILGNVRNLEILLLSRHMLPQCIFNSKTLVNLCLLDCVCNPSTGAVSLPCLKSLNLYRIQYQVKKSLPHLLSGCPVLEELIVGGIADDDLNCFKIASTTIKSLSLDIGSGNVGNVKINAPALRYLEVEEYSSYEHIRLLPVSNLIEADIWLNNFVLEVDDLNFLNSLSNVNRLKLSGRVEQNLDLAVADGSFVRFDNLIELELDADCIFLVKFLESAENIQVLIIHEVHKKFKTLMEPLQQVPKCLSSQLRTVTINQFGCAEHEFEIVRYLLRNAEVLERMEIYSKHDEDEENDENDFKAKFDALVRIISTRI